MTATPAITASAVPSGQPHRVIKLGVDVHWREHVVVRQIDGTSPQPAQRFAPEAFVAWVAKQAQQADVVHCCDEAGPFGFVLHRRLMGLGVKSLVVRPRNWDEYGKKSEDRPARRAGLGLVPGPVCRREHRGVDEHPRADGKRGARPKRQPPTRTTAGAPQAPGRPRPELPALLRARPARRMVARQEVRTATGRTAGIPERTAGERATDRPAGARRTRGPQRGGRVRPDAGVPTGLGALTTQILDREIGDWGRFKNRRQVASYTGLVPNEHSSGERRQRGAITKHGNPRVRHILIEASWRRQHFKPDYRPLKSRQGALDTAKRKGDKPARKKLCVALARQFIVDWCAMPRALLRKEWATH